MPKKEKPPIIITGGSRHYLNREEAKERGKIIKAWHDHADRHWKSTLSTQELVEEFHVDIGKMANLIADGALQIKGFNNSSWPTPEDVVYAKNDQERLKKIVGDVKVLVVSRKDLQDTRAVDLKLLELLDECFFDREHFVEAYTRDGLPAEIQAAGGHLAKKKMASNQKPNEVDGNAVRTAAIQKNRTAKGEVRIYAEKRKVDGNPLVAADFSDKTTNKTIQQICSKFKVKPGTLYKYVSAAYLLAPSKRGRKSKS
jgi:hypothetical protein